MRSPILRTAAFLLALCTAPARAAQTPEPFIPEDFASATARELSVRFPEPERARLAVGVRQAAAFWRAEDGSREEFKAFCAGHFATGADLDALFERFETKSELIEGHFDALQRELAREQDEDLGPLLPIDKLFGALAPAAHVEEDLFEGKVSFAALLNFPVRTLEDCLREGPKWSRRQWAEARLSQSFIARVPAEVNQAASRAQTRAQDYVDGYNIRLDRVVGKDGKPLFREGLRLISHWGLRDELRSLYAAPAANLGLQRTIYRVMRRIIAQEIPRVVVDNPKVLWDPEANTVDGVPAEREPDLRYANWLEVFKAMRRYDPYYPAFPSHMARNFGLEVQIPEADVETLFRQVLESDAGTKTAALIRRRLGRRLEPFDIWYDGFKARGVVSQVELDRLAAAKYPDLEAFQKGLPDILVRLGFDNAAAEFIAARIEADPARGAGHAREPRMRTEKAHLRTRVPKGGMDYQGFNTAMHELGHCVEEVLSLYKIDHTLLHGVPNNAFTEDFAFLFQARDLELLGVGGKDEKAEALRDLDDFWSAREIAGVALVDMAAWRWLYAHPDASPAEFREAVLAGARETWNRYYAPLFGEKDSTVLAVYSHMISYPLYLPNYPLGHVVAAQLRDYFRSHPIGAEMERMCRLGRLTPRAWMTAAVGSDVSAEPLLRGAREALRKL
ncbi:MAG: hypothetical protein WC969_09760 [Elusimicrobiota bacterium]|jgi:hypothetical protein